MTITSQTSFDGETLTIRVDGAFDFRCHAEFRRSYEALTPRPRQIVVDLAGAEYLDSSALGMLLLLRQFAGGDGRSVTLANARPTVSKILGVANFGKLFKVA
jgi:anti-anti-sigma factor